tara:strand:+ start:7630 stop:8022 length:393 start_codon:yes stop_codon:yes gene_type:complete
MGRYLNYLSEGGSERHFYKYVFGSQPSEIGEIMKLPDMEEMAEVMIGRDASAPALFIFETGLLNEYLNEWLAAYDMNEETFVMDWGYTGMTDAEYDLEIPSGVSDHFIDLLRAIHRATEYVGGDMFIFES